MLLAARTENFSFTVIHHRRLLCCRSSPLVAFPLEYLEDLKYFWRNRESQLGLQAYFQRRGVACIDLYAPPCSLSPFHPKPFVLSFFWARFTPSSSFLPSFLPPPSLLPSSYLPGFSSSSSTFHPAINIPCVNFTLPLPTFLPVPPSISSPSFSSSSRFYSPPGGALWFSSLPSKNVLLSLICSHMHNHFYSLDLLSQFLIRVLAVDQVQWWIEYQDAVF